MIKENMMEFTYQLEVDGWAHITHADGEQYRIRYDGQGEPLRVGQLHAMIVDGQTPGINHPTTVAVQLIRITAITKKLQSNDVCDTASRFLHSQGYACMGEDYSTTIVRLIEITDDGDWVIQSLDDASTITIRSAKNRHNG